MNFRRYLNKIQRKTEVNQDVSKKIKTEAKKILSFVDPSKNPHEFKFNSEKNTIKNNIILCFVIT